MRKLAATVLTATLALTLGVVPNVAAQFQHPTRPMLAAEGKLCTTEVENEGGVRIQQLTLVDADKWGTDEWAPRPHNESDRGRLARWASEGGFGRGCHSDVTYSWSGKFRGRHVGGKVRFEETFHHHGEASWRCEHTGDDPQCSESRHISGRFLQVRFRILGPFE